MRRFVSVWLPHWPIERLARHTPGAVPDDAPFALVESSPHGLRLTALNRPAARLGLSPGLPLADARAAVPALLTRPAEPERDIRALARLALWLGRYGPARNIEGRDGIWIDITGVAHLYGGEPQLLEDLVGRLAAFRLTARAALADTPGAAHALARFATSRRAVVIAAEGKTAAALAPLPIEALRLSSDAVTLLRRLGLSRIETLMTLPRPALERRFASGASTRGRPAPAVKLAEAVLVRLDQALGHTSEPRAGLGEPPLLCARRTWSEPLLSSEILIREIGGLVTDLCHMLKAAGLGARRIALHLYRADGTLAHAEAGLSRASADPAHLLRLLDDKLGAIDAGFGIDVAVIDALAAEPVAAAQANLEKGAGLASEDAIAGLVDRLSGRLGATAVHGLEPRPSHIPELSQIRRPPLRQPRPFGPEAASHAAPHAPPRPILLLDPPEPISVMAEVPDGPPLRFTWRRIAYAAARAAGPERIAPEWWRHLAAPATPEARDQTRDYYVVETPAGAHFWMFREGQYGAPAEAGAPRWFMHGLF